MDLNLFDRKNNNNNNFIKEFIEEIKTALENTRNKKEESNELDEYNRYERKKIFLDNKSKNGNALAWIMDEKSVCISENGDGGPFFINEIQLPNNVEVGQVYEKVNDEYVYNSELTAKLKEIM